MSKSDHNYLQFWQSNKFFTHLGLVHVYVNLHPHLNLQNNARNWKGHLAGRMINVEKEDIVIGGNLKLHFISLKLFTIYWKNQNLTLDLNTWTMYTLSIRIKKNFVLVIKYKTTNSIILFSF